MTAHWGVCLSDGDIQRHEGLGQETRGSYKCDVGFTDEIQFNRLCTSTRHPGWRMMGET